MSTYTGKITIGPGHIDAGNHGNFLELQKIAIGAHFILRDSIGMGLESLQTGHNLFLVMRSLHATYHKQLKLGDDITVELDMQVTSRTTVKSFCVFKREDFITTQMEWTMALVSTDDGTLRRIPDWMAEAIRSQ